MARKEDAQVDRVSNRQKSDNRKWYPGSGDLQKIRKKQHTRLRRLAMRRAARSSKVLRESCRRNGNTRFWSPLSCALPLRALAYQPTESCHLTFFRKQPPHKFKC